MIASAWRSHLDLRLAGKGRWRTLAPLVYDSAIYGDTITVPAELVTDLASVPRRPLMFLMLGGRCPAPAVVHDYLYLAPSWDDRELADQILYEAMGVTAPELGFVQEVNPLGRWAMYTAVRLAGWHAFNNHRRAQILNPIWSKEGWPEL